MGFFTFDHLHELWNFWEVRGIILFSLFLQSFLILVSPFRTKTANGIIYGLLWLAYLLADAAAIFAVGLISHSQGESNSADKTIGDLLAFWAPILIIHLGGPDTITALALEDNELWQRHLLQLLAQLAATLYVLYKSLTRDSELLAPTILVLIVGLIKYGERVYSLYLASVNKFRDSLLTKPDPGHNYDNYRAKVNNKPRKGADQNEHTYKIVQDACKCFTRFKGILGNKMNPVLSDTDKDRSDIEMVQDGYKCYTKFKGLVADLIYSNEDWQETRKYFSKRNPEQAFRVVEIELNFLYEALYTKMPAIRTWVGYILRLVCFALLLVSFFLWHSMNKSHMRPHDVKITYALVGGAITLDVIAFFMLIFSDWPIANVMNGTLGPEDESQQTSTSCCKLKKLINKYLAISYRRWSDYSEKDRTLLSQIFCFWRSNSEAEGDERTLPFTAMASRIFYRRWSESVQQFNLVDYSVNVWCAPVEKVCGWVGLTDFLEGIIYVSTRWFSESLRDSIFSELKAKSETMGTPEDAHEICKVRGEGVLDKDLRKILEPWLTKVDYDESLILWHIATVICYNYDINEEVKETEAARQQKHAESPLVENDDIEKQKDLTTSDQDEQQQDPKILKNEHDVDQQRSRPETLEEKIHEIEEEDDFQQQKGNEIVEEEGHVQPQMNHDDDAEQQKGRELVEEEDHAQPQRSHDQIEEEKDDTDDDAGQRKGHELVEEEHHVQPQKSHDQVEEEHHVQPQKSHDQVEEDDGGKQQTLAKEEAVEQQKDLRTTPADHEEKQVADQPQPETPGHEERVAQRQKNEREISKVVSDYMLYLLIREPKIMTTVAGIGQFRFRDTCAEAKKFFKGLVMEKKRKDRVRNACSKLLEVSTEIPPKEAKGDRSKSVLFEGCRLAKELNKLGDDKWNVIHKVWVEMLCYAATHCSGHTHAAQLSKGGQLITFVWLLMVHLGLGKQFLINEGSKSSR